jgi:hypothetical protein
MTQGANKTHEKKKRKKASSYIYIANLHRRGISLCHCATADPKTPNINLELGS